MNTSPRYFVSVMSHVASYGTVVAFWTCMQYVKCLILNLWMVFCHCEPCLVSVNMVVFKRTWFPMLHIWVSSDFCFCTESWPIYDHMMMLTQINMLKACYWNFMGFRSFLDCWALVMWCPSSGSKSICKTYQT